MNSGSRANGAEISAFEHADSLSWFSSSPWLRVVEALVLTVGGDDIVIVMNKIAACEMPDDGASAQHLQGLSFFLHEALAAWSCHGPRTWHFGVNLGIRLVLLVVHHGVNVGAVFGSRPKLHRHLA